MDQARRRVGALLAAGPEGVFEGVEDEVGGHARRRPPAEDAPGVGVDDERDVDGARPGRYVGEVGDPGPVRGWWVEPAAHQVGGARGGRVGNRGPPLAAPAGAFQAPRSRMSRSTVQRATGTPWRLSASQTFRAP